MTWIETAKQVDVLQVAIELGYQVKDARIWPCPGCAQEFRSNSDRRHGPVYKTRSGGWKCARCDASGDGVDFVAWWLDGRKLDRINSGRVRSWFAARGWCEAGADQPVETPVVPRAVPALQVVREPAPRGEVQELWAACRPVTAVPAVRDWLQSRALNPALVEDRDLARALPFDTSVPRWAQHWTTKMPCPILVPLWDGLGLVGLQGRRIDDTKPKSIAARDVSRHGVYACAWGRALLREELDNWTGNTIIVVEGEPDWLTWATWAADASDAPIALGFAGSGGWNARVASVVVSATRGRDVRVLVRTDNDDAGHRYAQAIYASLRDHIRHIFVRPPVAVAQVSA